MVEGINNPIEMRFAFDPFMPESLGVLLCEMEMVMRGHDCVLEPVRLVTKMETVPVDSTIPNLPTFRVGRRQLQALADELARVGVYPSKLPEATESQMKAHLDDLRHSRDYVEARLTQTLEMIAKF